MSRFLIRNYGPSRQVPFKGKSICLSNDQAIETDDAELAATFGREKSIHVHDRGREAAAPVPPEKAEDKKKRKVTVDNAEAVHDEKFPPDEDEQTQETGGTQPPPPESKPDKDEIAYSDMSYKEIQVLAKDRQLKSVGVKKAKLVQALEAYDRQG